jgi:serine/threonine protein kinase
MLQPGTLFDNRYELVRMIGRGGFAEVWLVKDTLTGLEEALKIYAPGSGMDEDGLKVFVKELIVAHDLHHPHLLTPNMLGQYERQPYLIMQYCPHGSLNKKVGKCTEDEAWQILEHVASGLAYLHEQGVVHQDIKPDNILKDAKGNYVITDFGISLRAQTTLRKSMRVQANSGTMAYMAPERFSAEPHPIPANDIWSLGAMMFEIIEGKVPFEEQGGGKQKSGADIPTMHADVSDNLKQVIRSLLALDPEERPTAAELVELIMSKRTQRISTDSKPETKPELTDSGKDSSTDNDGTMRSLGIIAAWIILIVLCLVVFFAFASSVNDSSQNETPEPPESELVVEDTEPYTNYVDLGLPSGTLWKDENEHGGLEDLFTFYEAYQRFGNQLPTETQLRELDELCRWVWTGNGYQVVGPNGNSIFLPVTGYFEKDRTILGRSHGNYWSRTDGKTSMVAMKLYFVQAERDFGARNKTDGHAVRLVK